MTIWLKQSTAVNVVLGPFIDDTDGKTAEAAIGITDSNTFLSKNGGAFGVKNETTHPTHDANPGGHYICALNTTDTNTLGTLRIAVHIAGALPVWQDYMVVPAQVWDSMFGADLLDVSTVQWNGTAVHTPTVAGVPLVDIHDQATALIDPIWDELLAGHAGAGSAGLALSAASAPSAASVADAVWDEAIAGHAAAGSTGKALSNASASAGAGAISWTITVNDGVNPLDGVEVWATTDSGGTNVVASGTTNALGQVTFTLDAGNYYAFKQLAGYNFTNPEAFTVV